ncbi:MAG: TIGR02147 family protein [Chitinispirillaceae bacterium]|nr:TIGR02147 family protein [Chitinispirillaceae bacterium]
MAMKEDRNTFSLSVFDYTDYRRYLADYYNERKRFSKAFSYRFFARKAGINSVGLYKDVIEGRQRLGRALIFKFSAAIGHTKKEAEYFENMVFFNEAATVEERTLFFERMMACQKTKTSIVDRTKYEYYQKWYYSAVRALVALGKFRDIERDYRKIARILNPRIRPDEAKKACRVLERLGFLCRNDEGQFVLVDTVITTGILKPDASVTAMNVVHFQKEMTALANESLDRFGPELVNLSTLTLGISEETIHAVKEELASLRNKLAALAEKDHAADRVFQLNMQFFPLSERFREEGGRE